MDVFQYFVQSLQLSTVSQSGGEQLPNATHVFRTFLHNPIYPTVPKIQTSKIGNQVSFSTLEKKSSFFTELAGQWSRPAT